MSESRHNPDQLSKEIQADEEKRNKGHLKIFFGAAGAQGHPGAGGRRSAPGRTGLCPKRPGPGAEAGRGLFHAAGRTICGPKGQHGQG